MQEIKKTGTVLDSLVNACYQQRMSKPLTELQRRVLDKYEPDSDNVGFALVAALDRIDFLERKLKAVDNHLVSALLSFADGEYNSPTLSDYTIQGRAIDALEAYNDITE